MIRLTASYTNTNNNFVIQNVFEDKISTPYSPAIAIIKNLLQRGLPTKPSVYLESMLGDSLPLEPPFALINKKNPVWERIIRGDQKNNYNPAQKFFDKLIPKYFPEDLFIQQLIVPEVPINFITQRTVNEFEGQQVDFYFPQAFLVIEIDGSQHDYEKDKLRDDYLRKYGVETVRFNTKELEREGKEFKVGIDKIKDHLALCTDFDEVIKRKDATYLSLNDYKSEFETTVNLQTPKYLSIAIIRFQLLLLELIDRGKLSFAEDWNIGVFCEEQVAFEELATKDLLIWFENLLALHKLPFSKPQLILSRFKSNSELNNSEAPIKIDFSITKRYTDEFQNNTDLIFVRTDHFDHYKYFKGDDVIDLDDVKIEKHDNFEFSRSEPIDYKLIFNAQESITDDRTILRFFLKNIFGYDDFNEGQLPILSNALARNNTIGLLPTGGGKSICYQLAALLQPAVSFVVCPIKSLMYDQKQDLENAFITRIQQITSDDDGEDKEVILRRYSNGKYFFIFISPERFQIEAFRNNLLTIGKKYSFAYAVIDEVHCLSEWGHDFRTSYLNLSKTIKRYCSNFRYLALTATASANVLKDIQLELDIKQEDVRTQENFTREEIEFEIIDDNEYQSNKYVSLFQLVQKLRTSSSFLLNNGEQSNCGIIFTPMVNGSNGCYKLSNHLTKGLQFPVPYFSGSTPKENGKEIMNSKDFEAYKNKIQRQFKSNKSLLLVATKAFGMGVNKKNISVTIHYGIPGSLESLYQEAGRAGRDKERYNEKNKAVCYVLFSKSRNEAILSEIWKEGINTNTLKELAERIDGDVKSNLYLFVKDLNEIEAEQRQIMNFINIYGKDVNKTIYVRAAVLGVSKFYAERIIYRLMQIGIIEDYTISNFYSGEFNVHVGNYTADSVRLHLEKTISKYDSRFSIKSITESEDYKKYGDIFKSKDNVISKCVLILINWIYDHFTENRKQSLKTIYENCSNYIEDTSPNKKQIFKDNIENYFKFSESTFSLQYIADNPDNIEKWFELFYEYDEDAESKQKIKSDRLIGEKGISNLKATLSRVLENYHNNVGLNFISGFIRLYLNDFNDSDGRTRFESAFVQILKFSESKVSYILTMLLIIGKEMNSQAKNELAIFIISKFPNNSKLLNLIQSSLGDQYTLDKILGNYKERIEAINKTIQHGIDKI
jgi:ATP-dependent DNA helicase RecQ